MACAGKLLNLFRSAEQRAQRQEGVGCQRGSDQRESANQKGGVRGQLFPDWSGSDLERRNFPRSVAGLRDDKSVRTDDG